MAKLCKFSIKNVEFKTCSVRHWFWGNVTTLLIVKPPKRHLTWSENWFSKLEPSLTTCTLLFYNKYYIPAVLVLFLSLTSTRKNLLAVLPLPQFRSKRVLTWLNWWHIYNFRVQKFQKRTLPDYSWQFPRHFR